MFLFLIGLISGIISGMGIGGGTVLIPALMLFLNSGQHIAQSTNLIYFIPTAVIALVVHIKEKRIEYKTAIPIVASGLAGACIGSKLAVSLSGLALKKYFGIFLLVVGCFEMIRKGTIK